jgi:hypothetical protein
VSTAHTACALRSHDLDQRLAHVLVWLVDDRVWIPRELRQKDSVSSLGTYTIPALVPMDPHEPHNVAAKDLWQNAINSTLVAIGLPDDRISPLQVHITRFIQGRSGAFGEPQKQCPHCEAPGSVAKTGTRHLDDGRTLSLIQRGALPNADTDPSIIGKQFGGTSATPPGLEAITAAHVKKVLGAVPRELTNVARTFASDPVAAICAAKQHIFVSILESIVRTRAR